MKHHPKSYCIHSRDAFNPTFRVLADARVATSKKQHQAQILRYYPPLRISKIFAWEKFPKMQPMANFPRLYFFPFQVPVFRRLVKILAALLSAIDVTRFFPSISCKHRITKRVFPTLAYTCHWQTIPLQLYATTVWGATHIWRWRDCRMVPNVKSVHHHSLFSNGMQISLNSRALPTWRRQSSVSHVPELETVVSPVYWTWHLALTWRPEIDSWRLPN